MQERLRARASNIIDPLREQFTTLVPERGADRPLGYHRPRIPGGMAFGKPVEVTMFGCVCRRTTDDEGSGTAPRCRRDKWTGGG